MIQKLICLGCFFWLWTEGAAQRTVFVADDRRHAIKLELLAPLLGTFSLGYEGNVKNGISLEGRMGVIGSGLGEASRGVAGLSLKAGPKFMIAYQNKEDGIGKKGGIAGMYLRPELSWAYFWGEGNALVGDDLRDGATLALLVQIGEQWRIRKYWLIDLSVGVGLGQARIRRENSSLPPDQSGGYYYAHVFLGQREPFVLSAGFSLGYLVK
jgi:hypothetical protein